MAHPEKLGIFGLFACHKPGIIPHRRSPRSGKDIKDTRDLKDLKDKDPASLPSLVSL